MQTVCDLGQLLAVLGLAGFGIFAAIITGVVCWKVCGETFKRKRYKKAYGKIVDWEKGDSPNEVIFYRPSDKTFYKTKITQDVRQQITGILDDMPPITFYNV